MFGQALPLKFWDDGKSIHLYIASRNNSKKTETDHFAVVS